MRRPAAAGDRCGPGDRRAGGRPARQVVAREPLLDVRPRVVELGAQRQQAVAVARLGPLGARGLEQDDVAVEEPGHPADRPVAEPQEDQRDPRQPDEREDQPRGAAGPGPCGPGRPATRSRRCRRPRRRASPSRPGRSGAPRSRTGATAAGRPAGGAAGTAPRSGASDIRTATSRRKTAQIARSAQAKKRCWPTESGPALEQPLGGDQADQDRDEDQDGVLEQRGTAAAEQGLHPDRQELLAPFGPHAARQPRDATTLVAQRRGGVGGCGLGRGGGLRRGRRRPDPPRGTRRPTRRPGPAGRVPPRGPRRPSRRTSGRGDRGPRGRARAGGRRDAAASARAAPWSRRSRRTPRPRRACRARRDRRSGRSAIRPSARSASSTRRRSSRSSQSAGPDEGPGTSGSSIRSPSDVRSSAATCAWSRERRNRCVQRASGSASLSGRASSRSTRRSRSPACMASQRAAIASSSSGCPSGRPSRPWSRSSSPSSQRPRGDGISPSSRAITAPSHSRSPRSDSTAIAWCSGSNSRIVSMCCAATRASASHCLARGGDLRGTPDESGSSPARSSSVRRSSSASRLDDGAASAFGRLVGLDAVELAAELHALRDGVEPGEPRAVETGPGGDGSVAEPARLVAPGCRHRVRVVQGSLPGGRRGPLEIHDDRAGHEPEDPGSAALTRRHEGPERAGARDPIVRGALSRILLFTPSGFQHQRLSLEWEGGRGSRRAAFGPGHRSRPCAEYALDRASRAESSARTLSRLSRRVMSRNSQANGAAGRTGDVSRRVMRCGSRVMPRLLAQRYHGK